MAIETTGLRLIICEDEFLLAMDMAQQMSRLGVDVLCTVGRLDELAKALVDYPQANAALLDVELFDGTSYNVVPQLEQRGMAIAFCSGHAAAAPCEKLERIAWFNKPASATDIATALCAALDVRSVSHH